MAIKVTTQFSPKYGSEVLSIPNNGMDIVVYNRWGTTNYTYNIQLLEDNLHNLTVCDKFKKSFLIFACATILIPNSKREEIHDLWDIVWDGDVVVRDP